MSFRRAGLALAVAALLTNGCATYTATNVPLDTHDLATGYRSQTVLKTRTLGDVMVVLAFSGGGTRAAALAYGILEELRDTEIVVEGRERRLLDEVDTISSVSGGSLTAAYYGLYGDRIFEDFEERVLYDRIQTGLLLQWLRPLNWVRALTRLGNRTELAIDYYDRHFFEGATFADLQDAGGPFIQINATDISAGERFAFEQGHFDFLCSDVSQMHIARAVAASAAVPVVFHPVILENYAGQCGFERPDWLDDALASRESDPRRYYKAAAIDQYLDAEKHHYLNLVDGGLSDNIGIRGPLDNIMLTGGLWERLERIDDEYPQRLLFIVVNASTRPRQSFAVSPQLPSLGALIQSVSGTQIHRYNFETIELLRESMDRWSEESSDGSNPLQAFLVEVAFDAVTDPADREFFNNVPTALQLEKETVDRLRAIARQLLNESPYYREFLDSFDVSVPEPAS